MKRYLTLSLVLFLLSAPFLDAQNRWIEDTQMSFKIQVPSNYQANQFWEGSDKIHTFLSPDQNVAVRVHSFKVANNITKDEVIRLFSQNVIKGAVQLAKREYTLNGIPGGLSGYRWKFNNVNIIVAAFYTIQNSTAYIVWSLVPENLISKRNAESDAITNSFTILASQPEQPHTADVRKNALALEPAAYPLQVVSMTISPFQPQSSSKGNEDPILIDPAQRTIHMVALHNGKDNGENFIVKWYCTSLNSLVAQAEYYPKINGTNKFHSFVEYKGASWPPGDYKTEIWHMGRMVSSRQFRIGTGSTNNNAGNQQKTTTSSPVTKPSPGIKQIVLDNKTYGYDFATGRLRTDYNPEPDVMNRPWCTPLPALTGNWVRTGKARMEDVKSAPSSGYLSDGKDFIDCAEAPLNEVLVFKLGNGKYAKLMILNDQQTKTSSGCEHKITCLVQYPAF